MLRPVKLNDFLTEVARQEPSFKCVFLSNNIDGSVMATNDWSQTTLIGNLIALWEDCVNIGQYKLQEEKEEQEDEQVNEENANPSSFLQTQIINLETGTVVLQNLPGQLLLGICSNKKDHNHAQILRKAQNVRLLIENEIKKISSY